MQGHGGVMVIRRGFTAYSVLLRSADLRSIIIIIIGGSRVLTDFVTSNYGTVAGSYNRKGSF